MIRPLLLVATLSAALIAGCGGSSSNTSTKSTTSTAKATKTTASATTNSSATSATSSHNTTATTTTPSVPPNLGALGTGAAAAYCQTALSAAKNLTSAEKNQFKSVCAALAHDSPSQLKADEKTLCLQIVKATVPSAYRSLANAECNKL